MQHERVDRRGWIDQGAFLRTLNFCHLLPGPEAQQLATWTGWRLRGTRGGLLAGLLFAITAAIATLAGLMLFCFPSSVLAVLLPAALLGLLLGQP